MGVRVHACELVIHHWSFDVFPQTPLKVLVLISVVGLESIVENDVLVTARPIWLVVESLRISLKRVHWPGSRHVDPKMIFIFGPLIWSLFVEAPIAEGNVLVSSFAIPVIGGPLGMPRAVDRLVVLHKYIRERLFILSNYKQLDI